MIRPVMLLVSFAVASGAHAATTAIWESSVNGGPYFPSQLASPGDVVTVRLRLSTDTPGVVGLAGWNFNAVVSNWSGAHALTPFDAADASLGGGALPGGDGLALGRIKPFGNAAATTTPTTSIASNVMTIGGSNAGRVALSQLPPNLAGANFVGGSPTTDVFRFQFTVRGGFYTHVMTVVTRTSDLQMARWYDNLSGSTAITEAVSSNIGAVIIINIPAPGALALLGLGGLVAGRRRR